MTRPHHPLRASSESESNAVDGAIATRLECLRLASLTTRDVVEMLNHAAVIETFAVSGRSKALAVLEEIRTSGQGESPR